MSHESNVVVKNCEILRFTSRKDKEALTLLLALVEFESGIQHTVLVSHVKETYMH